MPGPSARLSLAIVAFVTMALLVLAVPAAAFGYAPYAVPPIVPPPATPAEQQLLAGASVKAQDGWIVADLSGTPYQIGFQNGYLTAQSSHYWIHDDLGGPGNPYRVRSETIARRYIWQWVPDRYQAELRGIAAGMHAAGYPMDSLWDVVAANAACDQYVYAKLYRRDMQRSGESAAAAAAFAKSRSAGALALAARRRLNGEHCSAFVATGDATTDGQPVMGHNTWYAYHDNFMYNVMFFVHPDKGYDFTYQAAGGQIWSGEDWYENSTGLLLCETTIGDNVSDPHRSPIFVRARQAIQFDSTVAQVVHTFTHSSNGAYANEWLIADASGKIASLQLGCNAWDLHTKTNGMFGSCNYTWGENILAEAYGHPRHPGIEPARWIRWRQLKAQNYGTIDVSVGQAMLSDTYDVRMKKDWPDGRTLCGECEHGAGVSSVKYSGEWDWGAYDGKVATVAMAQNGLQVQARWGHPNGESFDSTRFLAHNRHWARDYGAFAVFGLKTFSQQTPNPWVLLQP